MMPKHVNRAWFFIFGGIFILLLFSNLIFPVTYDDDFFYSLAGNPFMLQWKQYTGSWHGRLVSHTPLRIILQWGLPYTDIAASLIALFYFAAACMHIDPRFWRSSNPSTLSRCLILIIILYAFIPVSCTAFGMTTFFMSNFFAVSLILYFLVPYSSLLKGETPQPRFLPLFAFLAGASHEQAAAIVPLLLISMFFVKAQGRKIPSWFWLGFIFLALGSAFILLAPSTFRPGRIIGYGRAESWEFMGQTLNWVQLGVGRYLYSFANWMLFTKTGAAWIPNAWPYLIAFGILAFKFRTDKGLIFQALFYFIGAWGLITIMIFSPLYYQANLIFGMVFIMLAVVTLTEGLSEGFLKKTAYILSLTLVCVYVVQAFAWNHYRKEYGAVLALVQKAKTEGASQVEVPPFTQFAIPTPLGKIYPVFLQRTPTFYGRMAEYYQTPPIVVKP